MRVRQLFLNAAFDINQVLKQLLATVDVSALIDQISPMSTLDKAVNTHIVR